MPQKTKIFVSYSKRDKSLRTELLDYLKGLENDGVEFWWDEKIETGELWDEKIKNEIAGSDIALVLISQAFLDTAYCTQVEISRFIADKIFIFPIVLSACEWEDHEWLSKRQFLPGGVETVEEHYVESGRRKRLFLKIRQELKNRIESHRTVPEDISNPFNHTLAIRDPARFIGREEELRRLQNMLQGGSVSLVGEPKIGKSSLMWRLAERWGGKVLGPIDFQGLEDRSDFYDSLAEELDLDSGNWRPIRDTLKKHHRLLLLDELGAAPEGFSADDLARFRSVCGHNPDCKVLTVSRSPLKALFPDSKRGSPAYSFLQPLTLGMMQEDEACHLLKHPWAPRARALDGAVISDILEIAENHPFKLQRAAFHRYEHLAHPAFDWRGAWREDMEQML